MCKLGLGCASGFALVAVRRPDRQNGSAWFAARRLCSSVFDYSLRMELRFDHVVKRFDGKTAVDIPSLAICPGEFFSFVGPRGAGKSTALNLVAGLEMPTEGALWAGERSLANVADGGERGVVVVTADTLPERSGSPFVVCDEPMSGLGPDQRREALDRLSRLHANPETAIVYATDDQEEALAISDRIAVLHNGQVQQIGSPAAVVDHPLNTFVAQYFGTPPMNVVAGILQKDGVAVEIGPRSIQLTGMVAQTFARDVFLGIRPEYVRLRDQGVTGWKARVSAVDAVDEGAAVEVTVDMGVFVALHRGEVPYQLGQEVSLALPPKHLHVFDERGGRLDVV